MKKNLKKLFALLLVIVMVAAMFAGCANNAETPAEPTTPSDTTDTTPTEDTTSTEEPAATETRENKVIYGSSTEISGDLGNAWWTNNASDKVVRDLINDYDTVIFDQFGQMVMNQTTAASIDETKNDDGTVTFTASGIREWNASDDTERFTWEQWDCCIISREVIVLTFHQPMLVLLPYTQESESTVVQALNAFGKQDTIYKV